MTSQQKYKLKYPERVKVSKEAWRKKNPDKHAAHSAAWRARNPQLAKETDRKWARNNPDLIYTKTKRRRARLKGAEHEDYNRMEIYLESNGVCHLCHIFIELTYPTRHPLSLSLDHIVPLANGGQDVRVNIAPAHYGCNSRKGNRV